MLSADFKSANNSLNCWEFLKFIILQRKDEKGLDVKVPKIIKLDNQQPSSEQEKVQRLSREGVGASASKWRATLMVEDIVYSYAKV